MLPYRTGIGYDIHRFETGRKLFLGGVEVPYKKGLYGHSDGDVVLHAICDALLGAMGKEDIGIHFPDIDKKYKDIASTVLLKEVKKLVDKEGYAIGNLDVVVIAQEPMIKDYKAKMKAHIAKELKISESAVAIKATTQEGLGTIGRKEGIASFANVILVKE